MRLSYLRHALKTAANPSELLQQEGDRLHLNAVFRSLLSQFMPRKAESAA